MWFNASFCFYFLSGRLVWQALAIPLYRERTTGIQLLNAELLSSVTEFTRRFVCSCRFLPFTNLNLYKLWIAEHSMGNCPLMVRTESIEQIRQSLWENKNQRQKVRVFQMFRRPKREHSAIENSEPRELCQPKLWKAKRSFSKDHAFANVWAGSSEWSYKFEFVFL